MSPKGSTNGRASSGRKRSAGKRDSVGRERVMHTALHLFLANGYAGTSLKSVADALGISPPALYWYFSSKEDLFVSVIEQSMTDFTTYVRASITDDDPLFALTQLVRAHVTWQLQQSEAAQVFDLAMTLNALATDISEERLAPIAKAQRDYVAQVRELLLEGNREGVFAVDDVKTTAFAIITLCEYVTSWYRSDGDLSIPAVANRYEQLVRKMIGAGARRAVQPDEAADVLRAG